LNRDRFEMDEAKQDITETNEGARVTGCICQFPLVPTAIQLHNRQRKGRSEMRNAGFEPNGKCPNRRFEDVVDGCREELSLSEVAVVQIQSDPASRTLGEQSLLLSDCGLLPRFSSACACHRDSPRTRMLSRLSTLFHSSSVLLPHPSAPR